MKVLAEEKYVNELRQDPWFHNACTQGTRILEIAHRGGTEVVLGSGTPERLQSAGLLDQRLNLICSNGTGITKPGIQRDRSTTFRISSGRSVQLHSSPEKIQQTVQGSLRSGLFSAAMRSQADPSPIHTSTLLKKKVTGQKRSGTLTL